MTNRPGFIQQGQLPPEQAEGGGVHVIGCVAAEPAADGSVDFFIHGGVVVAAIHRHAESLTGQGAGVMPNRAGEIA